MKTTFKTVFTELDDELMNLDIQENAPVDIDIEKIKSEVFMQINDENKTKKKYSKKFIVILANGNQMNELGMFDGGNVEVTSSDSSLNVELLGVIGDGEKLCSAISITKKDGSPVIDTDYTYAGINEPFDGSSWEDALTINGKDETHNALQSPQYVLSDGNKTLTIYLFTTTASGLDESLQGGRMTFVSTMVYSSSSSNIIRSNCCRYSRYRVPVSVSS